MRLLVFSVLLLVLLPATGLAVSMSAREVAVQEASAFVELIDQQRYSDAWLVGDPYLQTQLSLAKWRQVLRRHRVPLGRVGSRRQIAVRHLDGFESAVRGLYVEVEFRTLFGRIERIERLIVHRGGDSKWRVASYQLR